MHTVNDIVRRHVQVAVTQGLAKPQEHQVVLFTFENRDPAHSPLIRACTNATAEYAAANDGVYLMFHEDELVGSSLTYFTRVLLMISLRFELPRATIV